MRLDQLNSIARKIIDNNEVRVLNLANSGLADADLIYLSSSLQRCPKLESLYLQGNVIGDDGASCIVNLLRHHPTLKTVRLANNPITDVGKRALLDIVATKKNELRIYLVDRFRLVAPNNGNDFTYHVYETSDLDR